MKFTSILITILTGCEFFWCRDTVRYWVSKLVAALSAAAPIPEAGIAEMDLVVSFFCQNSCISIKLNRWFHRNDNASKGTATEVVISLLGHFFWAVPTLHNMKASYNQKIWTQIPNHSFIIYGSLLPWEGTLFHTLFVLGFFYSVGFYLSVWISLVASFLYPLDVLEDTGMGPSVPSVFRFIILCRKFTSVARIVSLGINMNFFICPPLECNCDCPPST